MGTPKIPSVLYDHQAFTMQKAGGISRYYHELIEHLKKFGYETKVPSFFSENIYLKSKQIPKIFKLIDPRIEYRIVQHINQRASLKSINRGAYDIFHPTYYSSYHLERNRKPLVMTVYDMIHELFPDRFRDSASIFKNKEALLKRADQIIAISECTKNDILKFINLDPDKISVIHLASSMGGLVAQAPKLAIKNFVLFVGERHNYKNFSQ